jgi:pimeloyl-ACP methyl ester carboxylesterase
MDDPCNVSNSQDPLTLRNPGNQQTPFLIPNPLAAECDHTVHSVFSTQQAGWDQLDQVVHHVLSTTGDPQVSLFSWSAGGSFAGGYLAQSDKQQNVANAVFLSSGFAQSEPPQPQYPTWLTGVSA